MKKLLLLSALAASVCSIPMDAAAQLKNQASLTIQSGASVYVEGNVENAAGGAINNDGTIHSMGAWTNAGAPTVSGMVIFEGSGSQTITGTTSFLNTQVDNTAGVQVSGSMNYLRGVMDLIAGNFNTNNNWTLTSTSATNTGQISGIGSGSLSNLIIAERFIPATYTGLVPNYGTGYHYVSSPVTDATFADYSDDVVPFILYDWPGGGTGGSYGTFYHYNETESAANSGPAPDYFGKWDAPSSIQIGRGYTGHIRQLNAYVADVDGHYNHAASPTLGLTYTSGVPNQGWNLVGNPYPSGLDWDAPTGWTKTNLNNAIYMWKPSTLNYASYVNGIGANGGTRYIAPQQGFMVRANGASPAIGFSNPARTVQPATFYKTAEDVSLIRLEIRDAAGERVNETVIRLEAEATDKFDDNFDAYKLMSPDEQQPDIYSALNGSDYSINALPLLDEGVVIPLGVKIGLDGTYNIAATVLAQLPANTSVVLVDKAAAYRQDLRANPVYTTSLKTGYYTDRFYLNLNVGVEEQLAGTNDFYVYSESGNIVVQWNAPLEHNGEVAIFDAIGQEMVREMVYKDMDKISIPLGSAAGYYFVRVINNDNINTKPVYVR
jgi:fibronectin-binding autotransporter adhesin